MALLEALAKHLITELGGAESVLRKIGEIAADGDRSPTVRDSAGAKRPRDNTVEVAESAAKVPRTGSARPAPVPKPKFTPLKANRYMEQELHDMERALLPFPAPALWSIANLGRHIRTNYLVPYHSNRSIDAVQGVLYKKGWLRRLWSARERTALRMFMDNNQDRGWDNATMAAEWVRATGSEHTHEETMTQVEYLAKTPSSAYRDFSAMEISAIKAAVVPPPRRHMTDSDLLEHIQTKYIQPQKSCRTAEEVLYELKRMGVFGRRAMGPQGRWSTAEVWDIKMFMAENEGKGWDVVTMAENWIKDTESTRLRSRVVHKIDELVRSSRAVGVVSAPEPAVEDVWT